MTGRIVRLEGITFLSVIDNLQFEWVFQKGSNLILFFLTEPYIALFFIIPQLKADEGKNLKKIRRRRSQVVKLIWGHWRSHLELPVRKEIRVHQGIPKSSLLSALFKASWDEGKTLLAAQLELYDFVNETEEIIYKLSSFTSPQTRMALLLWLKKLRSSGRGKAADKWYVLSQSGWIDLHRVRGICGSLKEWIQIFDEVSSSKDFFWTEDMSMWTGKTSITFTGLLDPCQRGWAHDLISEMHGNSELSR